MKAYYFSAGVFVEVGGLYLQQMWHTSWKPRSSGNIWYGTQTTGTETLYEDLKPPIELYPPLPSLSHTYYSHPPISYQPERGEGEREREGERETEKERETTRPLGMAVASGRCVNRAKQELASKWLRASLLSEDRQNASSGGCMRSFSLASHWGSLLPLMVASCAPMFNHFPLNELSHLPPHRQ